MPGPQPERIFCPSLASEPEAVVVGRKWDFLASSGILLSSVGLGSVLLGVVNEEGCMTLRAVRSEERPLEARAGLREREIRQEKWWFDGSTQAELQDPGGQTRRDFHAQ